ncbi:MAG: hypothetical protein ED557_11630 [Balneola sp.]|nr:MAG: hypothetical protein ED557_11630 [Balneola sp.]
MEVFKDFINLQPSFEALHYKRFFRNEEQDARIIENKELTIIIQKNRCKNTRFVSFEQLNNQV